ncbi:glycogen debranching enzyme N-terminal domain-containing protein [Actinoplanes sp. CA-051413]|uniref:glycogen debranching enzyme N-terminal domain-containing protein n=1 Tax=Actinoplanes sp. CA-051413 TaxID=3239899 RepID=UPI003D962341
MTMPIILGPQTCGSLAADGGAEHEWLVTDGLGGFASGTASGLRTRRYHALLTVADPVTAVRRVGLVALDLTLTLPSGAHVPLYTHEWQSGAIAPQGYRLLETFSLVDGLPRWRWRVVDIVIERELAMAHGSPSLAVVHRVVSAPEPVGLAVAAMCTWRDAHGERHADGPALRTTQLSDGVLVEDAYRLAEIVEHGVTGVRFAPQDPASLAESVGSVLADRDYARRLARRGRRRVREDFAWPAIAADTVAVYAAAGADGKVTRAAEDVLATSRKMSQGYGTMLA